MRRTTPMAAFWNGGALVLLLAVTGAWLAYGGRGALLTRFFHADGAGGGAWGMAAFLMRDMLQAILIPLLILLTCAAAGCALRRWRLKGVAVLGACALAVYGGMAAERRLGWEKIDITARGPAYVEGWRDALERQVDKRALQDWAETSVLRLSERKDGFEHAPSIPARVGAPSPDDISLSEFGGRRVLHLYFPGAMLDCRGVFIDLERGSPAEFTRWMAEHYQEMAVVWWFDNVYACTWVK